MKDEIAKRIEVIKENLAVLPKGNKDEIQKHNDYILSEIAKLNALFNDDKQEIINRMKSIREKYNVGEEVRPLPDIKIGLIKCLDSRVDSSERMNLHYYFYELSHFYKHDLVKINEIINQIMAVFKNVGITPTEKDFKYSESVRTYINAVIDNKGNTQEVFDSLYWANPDLITQIELSFRQLYFANEKKIEKFFQEQYKDLSIDTYLKEYMDSKNQVSASIHQNKKYLLNLFTNKTYSPGDFTEKGISVTFEEIIKDPSEQSNYDNLIKLDASLKSYQTFLQYEYLLDDIKKLFEAKDSYKGVYKNKLKEITKKESEVFKIDKKLNSTGLFKVNEKKAKELKLKRNNLVGELNTLYDELDSCIIGESIYNHMTNETSILDALKIVCFNFNYLMKLLKEQNEDITIEEVQNTIKELYCFIFGNENDILRNVSITENKNLAYILADRFLLTNINVNVDDLSKDNIETIIAKIESLIVYYDLKSNGLSIDNIDFLIKAEKLELE